MTKPATDRTRRRVVTASAVVLGMPWLARAQQRRVPTAAQTAGPFYPPGPLPERDNDLVSVKGGPLAKGEITLLSGNVITMDGRPLAAARVEIWQCNADGRYHHPRDSNDMPIDPNFQGYGEMVTDAEGAYRFRTIKPVPYPGRTPHIHVRVTAPGLAPLITQLYIAGYAQNESDGVFRSLRDAQARASVLVPFNRLPSGEYAARFDIVLAV